MPLGYEVRAASDDAEWVQVTPLPATRDTPAVIPLCSLPPNHPLPHGVQVGPGTLFRDDASTREIIRLGATP